MRYLARLAAIVLAISPVVSVAQAPQFDGRYPVVRYQYLCRDEFTMGIQCDPQIHATLFIGVLSGDWFADLSLWDTRTMVTGDIEFDLPPSAGTPFAHWLLDTDGLVGVNFNGTFKHYLLGLAPAPDPIVLDFAPVPTGLQVLYTCGPSPVPICDEPFYSYVPVAGHVAPEPATFALLAGGLGMLGAVTYRRRRIA